MIKREYSQEFKLTVVQEYIRSTHGIRVIARSFGLPSKNYITNCLKELLVKGLASEEELIAGKNRALVVQKSLNGKKLCIIMREIGVQAVIRRKKRKTPNHVFPIVQIGTVS